MPLKRHDLIKHASSMDCALRVWYDPRIKDGHIEFEAGWYNLAFSHSFFMGRTQTVRIPLSNLSNWYILDDPSFIDEPVFSPCSKSYRHSKWGKLVTNP